MTAELSRTVEGWRRGAERDIPYLDSRVERILAAAEAGRARTIMRGLNRGIHQAIGASSVERIRDIGNRLVPAVMQAIAEEDVQFRDSAEVHWTLLTLAETWNGLTCAGCSTPAETTKTIAAWLPRMHVSRDDPDTRRFHWRLGFAALALDRPEVYYPIAGFRADGAIPFRAGEAPGLNMQGTLAHLAGAVEARAAVDDVMTMWSGLLAALPVLTRAGSFDIHGAMWCARIIHHRLGGGAVGETGEFFGDSIRRLTSGG